MQKTHEQEAFCLEVRDGTESIILSAVAGGGKTTTILAALRESSIPPTQTLLMAFNAKIKEELAKRSAPGTVVLTLNGLGHRAWKRHIGKNPVLDSKKVGTIVSELCKDSSDKERNDYLYSLWADIKDLVNKAKSVGILPSKFNTGKGLVEDTKEQWETLAALHGITFTDDIYKLSHIALSKSVQLALTGQIDFDDQLYMPACFRARLDQYKLVVVDEAQDLSEIQHFLIARCVASQGRLIAVGDPHQAIYGFRGALSDSMSVLGSKFNVKDMELSYTFRCSKAATSLAQRYVPHIKAGELNPEGRVIRLSTDWEPLDLEEGSAILCRNIAPLVKLGMECIKAGISAYVNGRDIGAPLIKAAKTLPLGQNLHDAIITWGKAETTKAKGNQETISRVNDTTDALLAVAEVANCQNPSQLEETLRTLFSKSEGSIVLSTIHRAKGLEWNHVYILDFWRMPQKWILRLISENPEAEWMLEQEKNLAYIAITRTKDKLTFIDYKQIDSEVSSHGN